MTLATRFRTAVTLCTLGLGSLHAQTSTLYQAPNGLFDVAVPAGWTTDWDPKLEQVTLRHESTIAIVMAMTMPNETSAYAKTFLGMTHDEFFGQCKGSDELEHGPARLAGLSAQSFLVRCPAAPASVAGSTVAWAGNRTLLSYTVIAPIRTYGDDVATLDAIGASVHLTGTPAVQASVPDSDARVAEVKRACKAGSFVQEECARRIGMAYAGTQEPPAGKRYRDATGMFSVEAPAGWKATLDEKNGVKSLQLHRGSDLIALMPAPAGARNAKDVVLRFEAGVTKPGDAPPPFGPIGIVQIFGNGVELDYDHFEVENDKGTMIESRVAGIADISGRGPYVLMFTSIAKGTDAASLKVAQSVQFVK